MLILSGEIEELLLIFAFANMLIMLYKSCNGMRIITINYTALELVQIGVFGVDKHIAHSTHTLAKNWVRNAQTTNSTRMHEK